MARLPRLSLAGHVHHLLQRGNNRQPIFTSTSEHNAMLELLAQEARRHRVALHAYVLMPNHFHILATPEEVDGLSRMMQAVGRAYVRAFNQAHGRSGTLWEGRYRSTLLQPELHLLACMAYFDLNPVRAELVPAPGEYPWSSHQHYAGLRHDGWLVPPPAYWALGNTPFAREAAYAEMVHAGVTAPQQEALTQSVLGGWVLGDAAYVAQLQQAVPRRLSRARPGRPTKAV
ncbi:transposase [Pseudorhodoferax sp. Leaf267]|uniref:REP-associated tyrosine transposase n=1 Tax=Pseudorhodoferax sp. Leaf267 TaxID=1736316 RepID=UPI0007008AB8|nr:transposase [Pseudorhodoferax sp. Leaf267]KQP23212.1 transposase [Pseudorhodoferax sp. Leaf267]